MEKSKRAAAISGAWHLLYLLLRLLYCGEQWRVVTTEQTRDQMSTGIIFTLGDGLLKLKALRCKGGGERRSNDKLQGGCMRA